MIGAACAPTLALALALAPDPAQPAAAAPPDPPTVVGRVLADRRYRFCHDPQYPLTREELGWCDLLRTSDPRCPSLPQVCARGARADLVGRRSPLSFKLPDLPVVGRTFLWLLLGTAFGLAVWAIARHGLGAFRRARDLDERGSDRGDHAAPQDGVAETAAERDVFRLLDQARAAAAAGDFRGGIERSYAALMRKLEASELIRLETHRTNGDYLADLRRGHPQLQPRVAAVVTALEQVEFGGEAPGPDRFRWMHDRVVGLCAETLTRAAGLWVLAALGLLVATAGCKAERERWEDSPSGHSAVLATLRGSGLQARERIAPLAELGKNEDVALVLLPGATVSAHDWEVLDGWVQAGGWLLLAGSEQELPAWLGVSFDRTRRGGAVTLAPDAAARWTALSPQIPPGWPPVRADGYAPRLIDGQGQRYGVETTRGDGVVTVLADDRLFSNAALLAGDNARLLVAMLGEADRALEIGGELIGVVSPHPAAAVARGRLAPALLQLALLFTLFFLYRGAHFGRPQDPPGGRRRSFADHVRALGLLYGRARAGRFARELYGPFAIERLGERLRLSGRRGLSSIAEGVAARTGRPLGQVMQLLLEAREPASAGRPGGAADREALDTVRALAALLDATSARSPNPDSPPPPRTP